MRQRSQVDADELERLPADHEVGAFRAHERVVCRTNPGHGFEDEGEFVAIRRLIACSSLAKPSAENSPARAAVGQAWKFEPSFAGAVGHAGVFVLSRCAAGGSRYSVPAQPLVARRQAGVVIGAWRWNCSHVRPTTLPLHAAPPAAIEPPAEVADGPVPGDAGRGAASGVYVVFGQMVGVVGLQPAVGLPQRRAVVIRFCAEFLPRDAGHVRSNVLLPAVPQVAAVPCDAAASSSHAAIVSHGSRVRAQRFSIRRQA